MSTTKMKAPIKVYEETNLEIYHMGGTTYRLAYLESGKNFNVQFEEIKRYGDIS